MTFVTTLVNHYGFFCRGVQLHFTIGLSNYFIPNNYLLTVSAVFAILSALFALIFKNRKTVSVALLCFSVGLVYYAMYYSLTVDRAEEYRGTNYEIEAKVLNYPEIYESYTRLEVKILNSSDVPAFKAYLYDKTDSSNNLVPGHDISFNADINTADTLYGDEYNGYHSKAFFSSLIQ